MSTTPHCVSLVTGGASGIGLACVHRLLARGDQVIALDLPHTQLPNDLLQHGVRHVICDVINNLYQEFSGDTSPADVLRLFTLMARYEEHQRHLHGKHDSVCGAHCNHHP